MKKRFTVKAPGAKSVTIAGSFNGWNMTANPMAKSKNGLWYIDLELESGAYEYKFIKDGNWDALNKENRRITIRSASTNAKPVVFEVSAPGAGKVALAGSFNSWNTSEYFLRKGAGGKWSITLTLEPGRYEYKFLQDGDWDKLNRQNRTIEVK